MVKILYGKKVADELNKKNKFNISLLLKHNIKPFLYIIRIGENSSDIAYENKIIKQCKVLNVIYKKKILSNNITQKDFLDVIKRINNNDKIHGVLLFRPLPKHLNCQLIENSLDYRKDIDCMTNNSIANIFKGINTGFSPCTAQACIEILNYYKIRCFKKNIVIIGRSLVIGKPLAIMLTDMNATVTICHSKTVNIKSITKKADIIIVAIGKKNFIDEQYLNYGQVVIDVGINVDLNGKLCGDVNFKKAEHIVNAITPVPGGVGSVTTSVLISHVIKAALYKI